MSRLLLLHWQKHATWFGGGNGGWGGVDSNPPLGQE